MTDDRRLYSPAAERNKQPIAETLRAILPTQGLVLEIASGTGEHALHLARAFPALVFQPSDPNEAARASIDAWAAGTPNLRPALVLDAASPDWPVKAADAIVCINMVHIAPWDATIGLIEQAAKLLPSGAPMIFYGPFHRAGVPLAASNEDFDAGLRAQDHQWGLRHLDHITALASEFTGPQIVEMPANNLIIVYRRS